MVTKIIFSERSLIDHTLSETHICCPLSKQQIKQIMINQEKAQKYDDLMKDNE